MNRSLTPGLCRDPYLCWKKPHLDEGAGIGRLPHLDQRELPLECPPGEEEAGADGQEPVGHRPISSTGSPPQAAHALPDIRRLGARGLSAEGTYSASTRPSGHG